MTTTFSTHSLALKQWIILLVPMNMLERLVQDPYLMESLQLGETANYMHSTSQVMP